MFGDGHFSSGRTPRVALAQSLCKLADLPAVQFAALDHLPPRRHSLVEAGSSPQLSVAPFVRTIRLDIGFKSLFQGGYARQRSLGSRSPPPGRSRHLPA